MAGVPVDLTDDAMTDLLTTTIAAVALAVLIRPKLISAWLIGAGVAVGFVHAMAG